MDEARDHACALILLGLVRDPHKIHNDLGKTIPYVLTNAPCRVWVVEDPCKDARDAKDAKDAKEAKEVTSQKS